VELNRRSFVMAGTTSALAAGLPLHSKAEGQTGAEGDGNNPERVCEPVSQISTSGLPTLSGLFISVGTLFYAVNSFNMALITRAAEPGFPGLGRGRWRLSPCASAINDPARSFASMGISFDKALK
jgi:hypothetical protein